MYGISLPSTGYKTHSLEAAEFFIIFFTYHCLWGMNCCDLEMASSPWPFSFSAVALFALLGFIQMTIWARSKHRTYTREFKDYPNLRMPILPFVLWGEREREKERKKEPWLPKQRLPTFDWHSVIWASPEDGDHTWIHQHTVSEQSPWCHFAGWQSV